jgi:hypothetical protein
MVTVNSETGASLTIDDALAKEFGVKRGDPPVSDDMLSLIRARQAEIRARRAEVKVVNVRLEVPLPLADETTERVLVNQASLP